MRNGHHLRSHRELLEHFGIAVCVDDFGTEPLPIALLDELPIHSFKIEQRLVAGLEAGEGHDKLRRLVQIAAAFGRPATAVGVEAPRLRPVLAELGLRFAQGFCLQVPVEPVEAGEMASKIL